MASLSQEVNNSLIKDSPGLYGPHTVNTPRVIRAHTPFFYVTAIIRLRREIQALWAGTEFMHPLLEILQSLDVIQVFIKFIKNMLHHTKYYLPLLSVWNMKSFFKFNGINSISGSCFEHKKNLTCETINQVAGPNV